MKFILASSNLHKLSEFKKLLSPYSVSIIENFDADETGSTFEENAIIKLEALKARVDIARLDKDTVLLSDDSGLTIDSHREILGLYTSRFMDGSVQSDKNKKVLEIMKGESNRSAHYTCALAFYPIWKNKTYTVEGILEGTISHSLDGDGGFGYDPLFIPNGSSETLSSLGDEYKSACSHRARATQKMLDVLKEL